MDYFKFDEGELQANRSGYLSEKQKNDMLKRNKGGLLHHLFIAEPDISKVKVLKAEGPIKIVYMETRNNYHYEMHVGREALNVTKDLADMDIMKDGDVYNVYFDDYYSNILSVEFVSKAK